MVSLAERSALERLGTKLYCSCRSVSRVSALIPLCSNHWISLAVVEVS